MGSFDKLDPTATGLITVEGYEETPIICGSIEPRLFRVLSLKFWSHMGDSMDEARASVKESKRVDPSAPKLPVITEKTIESSLAMYDASVAIIEAGFSGCKGSEATVDDIIAVIEDGLLISVAVKMLLFCQLPPSEKKSYTSHVERIKLSPNGTRQKTSDDESPPPPTTALAVVPEDSPKNESAETPPVRDRVLSTLY